MLNVYTYWSAHYNEVAIIIAQTRADANLKFKEIYMPGCEVDDWIIGGTTPCKENSSLITTIIR